MTRPSRRSLLCGTASMLALSAGCLADGPGSASNDDGNGNGDDESEPDGNESPTDDENAVGDDLPDGLASYDAQPLQHPAQSSSPDAALLLGADDANDWLTERELQSEPHTDFVDETDFETSVIVALEAGAPNPCHELILDGIDIDEGDEGEDDDELVLDAAVRDTSDPNEACTAQVVTVGRLVRATFESDRLTRVSATIIDSDGQEHGFGIASESSSGSASRSTSVDGDSSSDSS
ncbi:hypothetical protein [Natrinema sp. 1APR25-10V2]|uniref:hypothetical protein n=1 Tax=Natrinema sp. 1APR25-10V2 TaxID=2951081 RepID=UPI00287540D4|nr:hypothetical protein [Natrinema sp. 1APR25-10V2]MDS0477548.1 hypothetical protein [Natrinema sp. 1APR25-10V2]